MDIFLLKTQAFLPLHENARAPAFLDDPNDFVSTFWIKDSILSTNNIHVTVSQRVNHRTHIDNPMRNKKSVKSMQQLTMTSKQPATLPVESQYFYVVPRDDDREVCCPLYIPRRIRHARTRGGYGDGRMTKTTTLCVCVVASAPTFFALPSHPPPTHARCPYHFVNGYFRLRSNARVGLPPL